jgi:hypothetical protein
MYVCMHPCNVIVFEILCAVVDGVAEQLSELLFYNHLYICRLFLLVNVSYYATAYCPVVSARGFNCRLIML